MKIHKNNYYSKSANRQSDLNREINQMKKIEQIIFKNNELEIIQGKNLQMSKTLYQNNNMKSA